MFSFHIMTLKVEMRNFIVFSCYLYYVIFFFFFFQAEDGIRDIGVTGVQTCALPILRQNSANQDARFGLAAAFAASKKWECAAKEYASALEKTAFVDNPKPGLWMRSEERRVGKECRSRWSPYH